MANGPCDDDDPEEVPVDESDLRLTKILAALEGLLTPREPAWAKSMARLRGRLEEGEPAAEVARDVLPLYSTGMGGWNDVVLQDARGVLPEQKDLDHLRSALFEAARAAL